MKDIFLKILSLFFLTILLTSNVLNLHIYLHQQDDNHYSLNACEDNNDNSEKDGPCELCLLAINLNDLDYNSSIEFSNESLSPFINHYKEEVLTYNELNYSQLNLNSNRNKAPPYQF